MLCYEGGYLKLIASGDLWNAYLQSCFHENLLQAECLISLLSKCSGISWLVFVFQAYLYFCIPEFELEREGLPFKVTFLKKRDSGIGIAVVVFIWRELWKTIRPSFPFESYRFPTWRETDNEISYFVKL